MRRSCYTLFAVVTLTVTTFVFWPKVSRWLSARNRTTSTVTSDQPPGNNTPVATAGENASTSSSKNNHTSAFPSSLEEWRDKLKALPESEAVQAIQAFLRTGHDSPTHQPFTIGPDGHLSSAPTLRTFLLDELGKRDQRAAAYAGEQILKESSSPDEWALAMKYYALGSSSPEKQQFLQDKMQTLLGNTTWQQKPSVGYLESFDVAVWLGGTNLLPALCDLTRKKDNQAVAHAGYLSLDRLVQNDPVATLSLLQSQPSLMEGREQTRANYFARADVTDPAQRTILENYLLNPALPGQELQTFAGLYPNANYMVSYNLLTSVKTPDGATRAQKDARALEVVDAWIADERFARIRPQLETLRVRLKNFVKTN